MKSDLNKIKVHTQDTSHYNPDYENEEEDEDDNEDDDEHMDQVYITNQKFKKQKTRTFSLEGQEDVHTNSERTVAGYKPQDSTQQNKKSQNLLSF